jgi:hypothetical protein
MDNRNNLEGAMVLAALGIAIFLLKFVFAIFTAIALCVTAAFSVIAIIAILNGGVTINGEHTSAREGMMFFVRGVIGAIVLSVVLALAFDILGERFPFAPHWVWLAGFVIGSTGGEFAKAEAEAEKARAAEYIVLPPLAERGRNEPPVMPTIEPVRPFHFATWDDEEQSR